MQGMSNRWVFVSPRGSPVIGNVAGVPKSRGGIRFSPRKYGRGVYDFLSGNWGGIGNSNFGSPPVTFSISFPPPYFFNTCYVVSKTGWDLKKAKKKKWIDFYKWWIWQKCIGGKRAWCRAENPREKNSHLHACKRASFRNAWVTKKSLLGLGVKIREILLWRGRRMGQKLPPLSHLSLLPSINEIAKNISTFICIHVLYNL